MKDEIIVTTHSALRSLLQEEMRSLLKELLPTHSGQTEEVLDIDKACDFLGIAKSTIYRLTSNHAIPFHRPGGKKIYFRRSELVEWLASNRHNVTPQTPTDAINLLRKGGAL